MTTKLQRIEARLTAEERQTIERAASLAGEPLSTFMVRAAALRAEEVFATEAATFVPAEWFDRLLANLDEPDEAPRLKAAVEHARRDR